MLNVTMVAAECKGIAKVGGLGDVVHDLSQALRAKGVAIRVVMPGYENTAGAAESVATFTVPFGGRSYSARLDRIRLGAVDVFLVRQPDFFGGPYSSVYVDSSRLGKGPFEDDANRFAFFSGAVAALMAENAPLGGTTVVHAHDWHAGAFLLLARLASRHRGLAAKMGFLFTIHNLDYQGIRPLAAMAGREFGSLASWFPESFDEMLGNPAIGQVRDPRHHECFNPMRAGIRLADRVSTVSPTYAREITRPDDPGTNFVGGRALEGDLRQVEEQGRLSGILNGISYEEHSPMRLSPPFDPDKEGWWEGKAVHRERLLDDLLHLADRGIPCVGTDPAELVEKVREGGIPLAVIVTRLASQKVSLLLEKTASLSPVLDRLGELPMALVILGTGEMHGALAEQLRTGTSRSCLAAQAFDPALAARLYAGGDLFLMPSDFEPCGISQMIAMRYGTVPVASAVGGLADTIRHEQTGFLFSGPNRTAAAEAFVGCVEAAVRKAKGQPKAWRALQRKAMECRFTWEDSAARYQALYAQVAR